jgi:hypothetical protein
MANVLPATCAAAQNVLPGVELEFTGESLPEKRIYENGNVAP